MHNILTIGSALVDIFIQSAAFQFQTNQGQAVFCQTAGDKLEVESFQVRTGGGASNTAVGFQRLGFTAGLIAEMGRDDFAQIVTQELKNERVNTQYLVREKKEETGGSVILVAPSGERAVMVHRGAAAQLDPGDIAVEAVSSAHWLHVSSIGGNWETLQTIFNMARHYHVPVSWNPGQPELRQLLEQSADVPQLFHHTPVQIMCVNREEWQQLQPVQEHLQTAIKQIVVTDGAHGGQVLLSDGQPVTYQAEPVASVDDTGAGDAFGVGYVSAHLYGKSIQEAITWGKRNAESVVKHVGAKAGLLRRGEI